MKKITVLLLVLASGCVVSRGKYDDLAAEHARTETQLMEERDGRRKDVAGRDETIARKEVELDQLRSQLATEQARSKELASRAAKLEADLANMLKDRTRLTSSVDEMKVALADLNRRKAEADARIAEFKDLISRFQKMIDAGRLRVKISDGRMVVELATDVLFPSGSAQLSKEGRAAVMEVARVLAGIPDRDFQVEGHTDDVPISTAQYPSNWELASARSTGVLKAMIEAGMPADRISAASFGESRPARPNDSAEGRAANRRIEIVLIPDLASLPGFDELEAVGGS